MQALGWKDPLEKEMTTQSSILAWEIPWTEELGQTIAHRVGKSLTQQSTHTQTTIPQWIQLGDALSHDCIAKIERGAYLILGSSFSFVFAN